MLFCTISFNLSCKIEDGWILVVPGIKFINLQTGNVDKYRRFDEISYNCIVCVTVVQCNEVHVVDQKIARGRCLDVNIDPAFWC